MLVLYEVKVLQMSKKLQVQKQQSNISNFKVRIIQRSVVLVQVAKKGQVMKMFTSARGQCTNIKSPPKSNVITGDPWSVLLDSCI